MTAPSNGADEAPLDVEDHFAIVPEWLLDAEISDAAVRLYAVLLRYGQSSGARMPSRSTLARRLRKKSTDSVDRAMRELVELGAVVVENRFDGGQRLTNRYLVRTSRPRPADGTAGGSRKFAATPVSAATRTDAGTRSAAATGTDATRGGRTDAARVAANLRHNPESLTQSSIPPPPVVDPRAAAAGSVDSWEEAADRLKADCGIADWDAFVDDCQRLRRTLGQPIGRWSGHCLLAALQLATGARGWPAARAAAALRSVAADPVTRSPMRLAEAGPWWDESAPSGAAGADAVELAAMESELADADGLRIVLQRQASAELAAEGSPVTRATVTRRAHELLRRRRGSNGAVAC